MALSITLLTRLPYFVRSCYRFFLECLIMLSNDICNLSITELAGHIKAQKLSPVEVTAAYPQRIEQLQPTLNAFIEVGAEHAMETARSHKNNQYSVSSARNIHSSNVETMPRRCKLRRSRRDGNSRVSVSPTSRHIDPVDAKRRRRCLVLENRRYRGASRCCSMRNSAILRAQLEHQQFANEDHQP